MTKRVYLGIRKKAENKSTLLSFYIRISTINKMTTIQNIHQFSSATLRPTSQMWSNLLCGDVILGFAAYNNEPKTGGTEV